MKSVYGQKPRLLDLYCGAGGAAVGYHRAGFEVVGVDLKPQPKYPFEFVQANALTFPIDGFDAVHASPLWWRFTKGALRNGTQAEHADDVTPIYERLKNCGLPWVVESGSLGPLKDVALFCGPAFGLRVIRHMFFACSEFLLTPGCTHRRGGCADGIYVAARGAYHKDRVRRSRTDRRAYREAAGIEWMAGVAADLAVPPAYTEFIGARLLRALERAA